MKCLKNDFITFHLQYLLQENMQAMLTILFLKY